ncbi:hypothetical protein KR093_008843, partial [Drosophila rubida]
ETMARFQGTLVPKSGIETALQPWEKIQWRPEIEKGIYKDWAKFYSRRGRENHALRYYDKAYDLVPEDVMILYYRSQSSRRIGQNQTALENCVKAREYVRSSSMPESYPINLETVDALYELNQFENAKAEGHNSTKLFASNKSQAFLDRLLVIDENIRDCCGDGLTPFLLKNHKIIEHVKKLEADKMKVDDRQLWKILSESGKCDVLSVPEIQEERLSPREIARRNRAFDICNQYYINKSWKDVVFLKELRKNPNVLMKQFNNSKELEILTIHQYRIINKFVKMIHARSPMYYMRYTKHSNKVLSDRFKEAQLSRIQYQTRRNMVSVLRTIKRLRNENNISVNKIQRMQQFVKKFSNYFQKLSMYVEEVMGEYVVLKTYRIMPWKFEFINEVYNTLALALAEQYYVQSNFKFNDKKAVFNLLHIDIDKTKDIPQFVFGDRSTHQDTDAVDPANMKSRKHISNFETRLVFAKYSIEKCYILHQISSIHLEYNRYAECNFNARKAIEESINCNSLIWRFLSTILIIKANASLNKIERAKDGLRLAHSIAMELNSYFLLEFVEMCIACYE